MTSEELISKLRDLLQEFDGKQAVSVQPVELLGPQTGSLSNNGMKPKFGVGLNTFMCFHPAGVARIELVSDKDFRVTVSGAGVVDGFQFPPQSAKDFHVNGDPFTLVIDATGEGTLWMSA